MNHANYETNKHGMKKIHIGGQEMHILGLEHKHDWRDFYFYVLISPWNKILILLAGIYLLINVVFACLYLLGGDAISNATPGSFWDAFFFSVQTWATIGYGGMAPKTRYADVLVAIESFSGLLSMSVVTGLVFAKFSQARAKVRFSKNIIMTKFDGKDALIFRMGNLRANQIVEARLRVVFSSEKVTAEGSSFIRSVDLKLARDSSVLFTLSWTAIHFVDESSPLWGLNLEGMLAQRAQIIVSFTGLDAEFNQTVHARNLYKTSDFVWGHNFADILKSNSKGARIIDYRYFDDLVKSNA